MDENYLEYKHKLKKATMRYNSSYPEVVHNNNRRLIEMKKMLFSPRPTKILIVMNFKYNSLSDLTNIFEFFGKIIKISNKPFDDSSIIGHYLLIEFIDVLCVFNAYNTLNGQYLDDHYIELNFGKSEATNCLWIGNVKESIDKKDLISHFYKYGHITQCTINRPRKHALIKFHKIENAQEALTDNLGRFLFGVSIQIDFASKECEKEFHDHLSTTYHKCDLTVTNQDHKSTSQSNYDTINDSNQVVVESYIASHTSNNDENNSINSIPLHGSEIDCINTMLEFGKNIKKEVVTESSPKIQSVTMHSNTLNHCQPENHIPSNLTQFSNDISAKINLNDHSNFLDKYPLESHIPSTSTKFSNNDISKIMLNDHSNFFYKYPPESHIPSTSTRFSNNNISSKIRLNNHSNFFDNYPPNSHIPSTSTQFSNNDASKIKLNDYSNFFDNYPPNSHIPLTSTQFSNYDISSKIEINDHSNLLNKYPPQSNIPFTSTQFSNNNITTEKELNSDLNLLKKYPPESHLSLTSTQISNNGISPNIKHTSHSKLIDMYPPESHILSKSSTGFQVSDYDWENQFNHIGINKRFKFKKVQDLIFEPSVIVKSILEKPSVFTADAERLKHVSKEVNLQEMLELNQSISYFKKIIDRTCCFFWEPLFIHPDRTLLNERKTTDNPLFNTDYYVPKYTKNFNYLTHIDVNDGPEDKNVNQKTETEQIKTINDKICSTKTSTNILDTFKNENPIKKVPTTLSCSKDIKAKDCKRTNILGSESKKCEKPSIQLFEFDMFEVKQVNNKKKELLINEKNYNTEKKENLLNLKKNLDASSSSNVNVKELNKNDILKVNENCYEEYLHKKIRQKRNIDNNDEYKHTINKKSRHDGKFKEVKMNEKIDSDKKFNDDKKQKMNKEVEKISIGNEIAQINIKQKKTSDISINRKNTKRSKIDKIDSNDDKQKKKCTKNISLLSKLSNDEIKEQQKAYQNHKNETKIKKEEKKNFKTLNQMDSKKPMINNSINDCDFFTPYVSMYDKVKARTSKSLQKKDEHRQKLSEKCKQIKQKTKNKNVSVTSDKSFRNSDRYLRSSSKKKCL